MTQAYKKHNFPPIYHVFVIFSPDFAVLARLCSNYHSHFHLYLFLFFFGNHIIMLFQCTSFNKCNSLRSHSFSLHIYPPFSISNPFFSIICPSIPPLEKVTFAVKRSSPPLYHAVKKCHDIMSLVDTALILPLMFLPYLSFSFFCDSLSQSESVSLSHPISPLSSSEGRVSIWLSVSCSLSCCPVTSIALQCQYIAPLSHTSTLMDAHMHPDGRFQPTLQIDGFAENAKNFANTITINFR